MADDQLKWSKPGTCPSCGVVTDQRWDGYTGRSGQQGDLYTSQCVSLHCQALVVWIRKNNQSKIIFPQTGVRIPPQDGLTDEEVKLYEEAASVRPISPRAACALVRVLLEAFLKRSLATAGHSIQDSKGRDKRLTDLIDLAVQELDLSSTLKQGLTAIRGRGNTAVHDPYGLTDDARAEDLPWLFEAVDDLVDALHVKPQKWGKMVSP